MMWGYGGNVLVVDLSTGEGKKIPLDEKLASKYLGGDGFGAYYMNTMMDASVDALSPDNILVIAPGLFTATPIPTAGKTAFFAKSPLTNGWNESVMGGRIGVAMKQAGYDVLIIKGRAEKMSYLLIRNNEIAVKKCGASEGRDNEEDGGGNKKG